jgi:acyl carrier protein
MEEEMLNERVFNVISQVMKIPVKQINEHSSPENIAQWDSLQHMNLILALEEDFKIKFTYEEIVEMKDANLILKALHDKNISAPLI